MIAIEIREALEKSYPNVTDLEFSIEHSGSAHEHPLIAIGVLLISSIVLETTAPAKLAEFTRYSERFMRAVARNMEISGLWANDRYDCWSWSRGEHVPQPENREFWDHAELPAPDSGHSSDGCVLECVAKGVSTDHSSRTHDYKAGLIRCRSVHERPRGAASVSHDRGRSSIQST